MFSPIRRQPPTDTANIITSKLYDQQGFYDAFMWDLRRARTLVVIESPFITKRRTVDFLPVLRKLHKRGVKIVINTKPIDEHDHFMAEQSAWAIAELQDIGITVLNTDGHHRKVAIVDDILWEGSLNILSQNDSCEIMRRVRSDTLAQETLRFIGASDWM